MAERESFDPNSNILQFPDRGESSEYSQPGEFLLTETASVVAKIEDMKQAAQEVIADQLLSAKHEIDLEELAARLKINPSDIKKVVHELKKQGYGFHEDGDVLIRTNARVENEEVHDHRSLHSRHLLFAVMGDTHLSSKKERLDDLNRFYDLCVKEGVKHVYHAGDVSDGYGVFKGQEFEIKHMGQEEQIGYVIEVYPKRPGVTTHFITGNHDLRAFEKGGVDPGIQTSQQRPDMQYLGQAHARVLIADKVEMELLHPAGGISYALSYKAQRMINNLSPDQLPQIMVHGHYHTSFHMCYRGINFLQSPCFKDAGIFERRLGLNPVIGGWIVEALIDQDGQISRFRPELFTFNKGRERVLK